MLSARPYPHHYVSTWIMKGDTPVTFRPIRAEDVSLMAAFHASLSEHSVYFRYFQVIALRERTSLERLYQICHIDYDSEIILVVERAQPVTGLSTIIAVGHLNKVADNTVGEFAIVVSDRFQGNGLGTELLLRLIWVGQEEHLRSLRADIHPDNSSMLRICRKLNFRFDRTCGDPMIAAAIDLPI